jgi:myxalamid-type nonribosomal peptide synthetase MxaA
MTKKIYCLVRGKDGLKRVEDRFKELNIFGKVDMKKITVLEGNITDERFGLTQSLFDDLGDEVDAIVNSSACTNHLAKYKLDDHKTNGPRHVNLNGNL